MAVWALLLPLLLLSSGGSARVLTRSTSGGFYDAVWSNGTSFTETPQPQDTLVITADAVVTYVDGSGSAQWWGMLVLGASTGGGSGGAVVCNGLVLGGVAITVAGPSGSVSSLSGNCTLVNALIGVAQSGALLRLGNDTRVGGLMSVTTISGLGDVACDNLQLFGGGLLQFTGVSVARSGQLVLSGAVGGGGGSVSGTSVLHTGDAASTLRLASGVTWRGTVDGPGRVALAGASLGDGAQLLVDGGVVMTQTALFPVLLLSSCTLASLALGAFDLTLPLGATMTVNGDVTTSAGASIGGEGRLFATVQAAGALTLRTVYGDVTVMGAGPVGASPVLIGSTGTLTLRTVVVSNAQLSGSGTVTFGAGATIRAPNDFSALTGPIRGPGSGTATIAVGSGGGVTFPRYFGPPVGVLFVSTGVQFLALHGGAVTPSASINLRDGVAFLVTGVQYNGTVTALSALAPATISVTDTVFAAGSNLNANGGPYTIRLVRATLQRGSQWFNLARTTLVADSGDNAIAATFSDALLAFAVSASASAYLSSASLLSSSAALVAGTVRLSGAAVLSSAASASSSAPLRILTQSVQFTPADGAASAAVLHNTLLDSSGGALWQATVAGMTGHVNFTGQSGLVLRGGALQFAGLNSTETAVLSTPDGGQSALTFTTSSGGFAFVGVADSATPGSVAVRTCFVAPLVPASALPPALTTVTLQPPAQCTTACSSAPCHNGAVCLSFVADAYECVCPAGFSGAQCQTDMNECSSQPCRNGGTCLDAVGAYTCQCAAGFHGPACENDWDECASNPCANAGVCVDGRNGFACDCTDTGGWYGPRCTDFDECRSNPCANGARCVDAPGGFTCVCASGFRGVRCETDTDECASQPCQSGGVCVEDVNGFRCACPGAFYGTVCQHFGTPGSTGGSGGDNNNVVNVLPPLSDAWLRIAVHFAVPLAAVPNLGDFLSLATADLAAKGDVAVSRFVTRSVDPETYDDVDTDDADAAVVQALQSGFRVTYDLAPPPPDAMGVAATPSATVLATLRTSMQARNATVGGLALQPLASRFTQQCVVADTGAVVFQAVCAPASEPYDSAFTAANVQARRTTIGFVCIVLSVFAVLFACAWVVDTRDAAACAELLQTWRSKLALYGHDLGGGGSGGGSSSALAPVEQWFGPDEVKRDADRGAFTVHTCGKALCKHHLWLSVLWRPRGDPFTSRERVAVLLCSYTVTCLCAAYAMGSDTTTRDGMGWATVAFVSALLGAASTALLLVPLFSRAGPPSLREQFEAELRAKQQRLAQMSAAAGGSGVGGGFQDEFGSAAADGAAAAAPECVDAYCCYCCGRRFPLACKGVAYAVSVGLAAACTAGVFAYAVRWALYPDRGAVPGLDDDGDATDPATREWAFVCVAVLALAFDVAVVRLALVGAVALAWYCRANAYRSIAAAVAYAAGESPHMRGHEARLTAVGMGGGGGGGSAGSGGVGGPQHHLNDIELPPLDLPALQLGVGGAPTLIPAPVPDDRTSDRHRSAQQLQQQQQQPHHDWDQPRGGHSSGANSAVVSSGGGSSGSSGGGGGGSGVASPDFAGGSFVITTALPPIDTRALFATSANNSANNSARGTAGAHEHGALLPALTAAPQFEHHQQHHAQPHLLPPLPPPPHDHSPAASPAQPPIELHLPMLLPAAQHQHEQQHQQHRLQPQQRDPSPPALSGGSSSGLQASNFAFALPPLSGQTGVPVDAPVLQQQHGRADPHHPLQQQQQDYKS